VFVKFEEEAGLDGDEAVSFVGGDVESLDELGRDFRGSWKAITTERDRCF